MSLSAAWGGLFDLKNTQIDLDLASDLSEEVQWGEMMYLKLQICT